MEEPNNEKPKKAPKKQSPAKAKKSAAKPKRPKSSKQTKPVNLAALSALFSRTETLAEKQRRKNMDLLASQTEEFLSSFIIIGYNLEGEPVNITYASNPKDYDALSTGLQKYIFESMYKNQLPPGNM
tara:strand:- start:194 stop:574 length:381 start_codon:yes stop_codon:yes gene_type:complete